jgi:hypothetical protein
MTKVKSIFPSLKVYNNTQKKKEQQRTIEKGERSRPGPAELEMRTITHTQKLIIVAGCI